MKKRGLTLLLSLLMVFVCVVPAQAAVSKQDMTFLGGAYYDSKNDQYVLTEEKTWQSGGIWFDQVRCNDNFSISLDFYTGHADHYDSLGGADGLVVAFYAKSIDGTDGGGMGFLGCGGYGIEIDTYYNYDQNDPSGKYNHIAIIKDNVNNHLQSANADSFTEDGQWHHLKVENRQNVCTVWVDGNKMLQQKNVVPNGQYEIGITAGTGGGYNFHAVKNVNLIEAVWEDASDWANSELEQAQEKGLIPETLYNKDLTRPITRAEFASVAVRLYETWTGKTAPAKTTPFGDISNNPCKKDIEKAYAIGVTDGTSPTTFAPDVKIPREQLATMLCRVYKGITYPNWTLANDSSVVLDTSGVPRFADDNLISGFAWPSVYFMVKHNVIGGVGNNKFAPRATTSHEVAIGYALATREQALAMSLRSLENLS